MPDANDTLDLAVKRETPRAYRFAEDAGEAQREKLLIALCNHSYIKRLPETPAIDVPITQDEAMDFILSQIGLAHQTTLENMLRVVWARLACATTAEQLLSLERLITAIAIGIGMTRHAEATAIIERNLAREEARRAAELQAHALNRWRRFSPPTDQG